MPLMPPKLREFIRRHPRVDPRYAYWGRRGWVECRRQGLRWKLRLDHYVDREVFYHGGFERETTDWLREVIRPGMRIVDVGANFGYFTTLCAHLAGPSGHVWAFEPTRFYGDRIGPHLEMNGLTERCTLVPLALSDHDDECEITISRSSATMHPVAADVPERMETIRLRRLDDVVDELKIEGVDFMKIDIDGHEPAMLRGAMRMLRRHRPILLIEFSQANLDVAGSDVREVRDLLESAGYALHSETTRQPYASREQFLRECGNFTYSANVWAFPRAAAEPLGIAA